MVEKTKGKFTKMAIYHLNSKPIERSKGRSSVACIAYRAGIKIHDERLGKDFDFSKRDGVLSTHIITPNNIQISRDELWNLAEKSENRKNGRPAREIIINLPHELDEQARQKLAVEFAQMVVKKYGVAVDMALHHPDKQGDNRNFHAHLLLTTRQLEQDSKGNIKLGKKAEPELSNTQLKELGLPKAKDELTNLRKAWADLANAYLAEHGLDERIDHRSHKDRGLETLPTVKMGWKATELERQGIRTEVGDQNRAIRAYNAELEKLTTLTKQQNTQDCLKINQKTVQKSPILPKNEKLSADNKSNTHENARRATVEPRKNENGIKIPPTPTNTLKTQIMAFYDDYQKTEQELLATQPILDEYLAKCNERAKKLHAIETKQANNRQSSAWKAYQTLDNNKPLLQDLRPKFMGKSQWELDKEQAYNEFWQAKQAFLDLYKQEPKERHKQQAKEQIEQEYPELCKQASKHWLGLHKHEWQTKQYIEKIKSQVDEVAEANATYFGEIIAVTELGILQETKQGVIYHSPKDVELNQNQVGKVLALEYPKVMFADKQLVEVKTQSQYEKQQSQLDKNLTKGKGRGFGD